MTDQKNRPICEDEAAQFLEKEAADSIPHNPTINPKDSPDARVTDALDYLQEMLPLGEGHMLVSALPLGGGWHQWRGIHANHFPENARPHILPSLALELVSDSDRALNMFICPYPHTTPQRHKGGAVARRHVHADIDGPLDLTRVAFVGGMAVASGSVATDGQPHGHAYVRLDRSVSAREHRALCHALGQFLSPSHADTSKVSDEDVLRPPGTLNFKLGGDNPRPVRWLIRPDDESVRTWAPELLAPLLGPHGPVPARARSPRAAPEGATTRTHAPEALVRRLHALVRYVRGAGPGEGNSSLYWAAKVAGAIYATEPGVFDKSLVRDAMIAAYTARPDRHHEGAAARQQEAGSTFASGWAYGSAHYPQVLQGGGTND